MKKKNKRNYSRTVFPNGLTLVTDRVPHTQSLAIGFWINAGSCTEQAGQKGISHFLEHMVFKGTRRRTGLQISRTIEDVGGEINAFTARENTCFHVLLQKKHLELGVDVLSDIVMNAAFDPKEFRREKGVILQEIAMVDETPDELAYDVYHEKIYGDHGLGWPILGTDVGIQKMKRQELIDYYHQFYRPENTVISIAGDLSHTKIRKLIEPFGKRAWPKRGKKQDFVFPGATPVKPGRWWITRPTEQVHLILGVPGPSISSEDRFAFHVLNTHLGSGMGSLLFQEVREKNGLSYSVYSSLTSFRDSGVFTVYAATQKHQVVKCIRLIEKCLRSVSEKKLSPKHLKAAKENIKGAIVLGSEGVEARMSSMARSEMYFDGDMTLKEVCRQIDRVTASDLQQLAKKLFDGRERSLLALGPKPKAETARFFRK